MPRLRNRMLAVLPFRFGEFPGSRRWGGAALIEAIGTGLLMPLSVLYFRIHVGLSTTLVGLGLTVGGLAALALAPLAGVLIDAAGAKRVLLGCWLVAALAFAAYGLVVDWAEMVAVVTAANLASYTAMTASTSLIASLTAGAERVQLLASQRALQNVGFAAGGLLATLVLAVGGNAFTVAVYVNAGSYLVPIVLVAGIAVPRHRREPGEPRYLFRGLARVARDRRYLTLGLLDFLSNFHDTALLVALPLWVVLYTRAPHATMGILFLLNTVIVVFAQVRVSARVRHLGDVLPAAQRAVGCLVLCAAAYLGAHYVGPVIAVLLLVAGVAAHTGVEMLADTGQWVASTELADPDHRGTFLAVFSLGSSLAGAVGPTLVAGVLLLGSVWLWPVLAVMIATGTLATGIITRRSAPERPSSPAVLPEQPCTSRQL